MKCRFSLVRTLCQGLFCAILCLTGLWSARPACAAGWLGPNAIVASPDGTRLFVAQADAKQLAVVDPAAGKVVGTLEVPGEPTGMVFDREGKRLFVTCAAPKSTVAVIDPATLKILSTLPAGHTAMGPAVSADGKRLYVCNRFDNDVSVLDLATGKEIVRVPVVREPHGAVLTPDGKTLFVINHLPLDRSDSYDVAAMVSVIDTAENKATSIRLLNGSTGVRGIAISPDGKYVYVTHILARYQMPTTQLERGWMNTNALTIIDAQAKKLLNTVLLDDVDLGAAVPWGVACSADGELICVAHAGTHELSVVHAAKLFEKLGKIPADAKAAAAQPPQKDDRGIYATSTAVDVPNDLAFLVDIRQRVQLEGGAGSRGVAVVGTKAYVTQYFSDCLAVVDLAAAPEKMTANIALGPAPKLTIQRRGEMLFNDATICFQHWQSCGSCHPDTRADGLNWDLMNDGLGNPKNNKSLLLAHQTPPSMWTGARPNAESGVRSGITHILFAVRPEEEAVAMDEFLKALQPTPSPHLVDGHLSASAQRGKRVFTEMGCAKCHPAPLYTDLLLHDVKSEGPYDHRQTFDTPTLVEVWRTAPYLHDGHWLTMKELLTTGKHGHKEHNIDKLTPQEIDDLVEFVMSL
jgi:YVTN family beta-propeller protein